MNKADRAFYNSQAWKDCRRAYRKSVGGLCEMCLAEGRYTPGDMVHHRIHLTPANINNPGITLNWNNLQLLCRDHHALVHGARAGRYIVDENGRVSVRDTSPQ